MQASAYLGDLGGLAGYHELNLLDLRGTGDSAIPADPASYRVDHQVGDVEAFRRHLGIDRVDLLTHSGGATLALLYAARHPERVERLVLVNPSPNAVGLRIADGDRRKIAELRRDEPWFPEAFAALQRLWTGEPTAEDGAAITPFIHGRWDDSSKAVVAREAVLKNHEAAAAYYGEGAFDPVAVRAGLTRLTGPVLLITGEFDIQLPPTYAPEYADLFRQARVAVLERGGHFSWLDDPEWLVRTVTEFLMT